MKKQELMNRYWRERTTELLDQLRRNKDEREQRDAFVCAVSQPTGPQIAGEGAASR